MVVCARANMSHAGTATFRCFLDHALHLTPAIHGPQQTLLEEAFHAFDDAVLAQAGIQDGSNVLELGGGWGALALRATSTHACRCASIAVRVMRAGRP